MKQVSLIEKYTQVMGQIVFDEIFKRVRDGYYAHKIIPLRNMLDAGNKKGYDEGKCKLNAITPCASFDGRRKMEHMIGYNSVIVGDVDHISDDDMPRVWKIVIECDYTLACFLSPSGHGLKFFVTVSTGVEDHLNAFNSVVEFYEVITGVKIDRSGKDVTRLCFVSYDPNLYYNREAKVFDPLRGLGRKWFQGGNDPDRPFDAVLKPEFALPAGIPGDVGTIPVVAKGDIDPVDEVQTQDVPLHVQTPSESPVKDSAPTSGSIIDIYARCVALVSRYHTFVDGQRNEFVYSLALQLRKTGQPEAFTLFLLLQDYNFDDREVRSCVKSAYNHTIQVELPRQTKDLPTNAVPAITLIESENGDASMADPLNIAPVKKERKSKKGYVLENVEDYLKARFETRNNTITKMVEWRRAGSNDPFVLMSDNMVNSIYCDLHHLKQFIPINTLNILLNSNFNPPVDPFIDYLDKLPDWNRKTDYIGQLIATVKTHDEEYWDFCFRKWFVAFVASLLFEKIINHTIIVFVGDQGIGKSSWIKKLLPVALREYWGSSSMQTDSKDTSIQVSECALIQLDELESFNRKDLASLKEIITRPAIRIRRPYARIAEYAPHRASFFASINDEQMLTDITGSRRYLCFIVSTINYLHEVDIDGAMAQALALIEDKFRYWFNPAEIKLVSKQNERFVSKSVEQEQIETWLRPVTRKEWNERDKHMTELNIKKLTATQIASEVMGKIRTVITDPTVNKIGKILLKLGYERIRQDVGTAYLVRLLDGDTVERNTRKLDINKALDEEQAENEQIIRLEEDLSGGNADGSTPF